MSGNPDKLDGWGQIEMHLGVDRKTVIARGYPVRRYKTGQVYAFASELLAHEKGEIIYPPEIPAHCQSIR